jgi:hypothetical protein
MADSKHVRVFKARYLEAGEVVVASAEGYIGKMMGQGADTQRNGALIVTDRRAVFYRKGIFGEVQESIPLSCRVGKQNDALPTQARRSAAP